MVRGFGVFALVALVAATAAAAAGPPGGTLKAFTRPHHPYDNLPAAAKQLIPTVVNSRRVATAVDSKTKKNQFLVYVTLMKDNKVCSVLVQGKGYSASCTPQPLLFATGRETFSVNKGLIGGVAANNVTRLVLVGGSKREAIKLTSDNGYIYGCPSPSTCASWVKTIVGYDAAGKIISHETVG